MLEVEYFPAPLSDYATRNLAANPTYYPMGQMESGVNAEILIFGADRHAQIF